MRALRKCSYQTILTEPHKTLFTNFPANLGYSRYEERVGVRGQALTLLKKYTRGTDRTTVPDDLSTVMLFYI